MICGHLAVGFDVEESVVGADRYEEVMQEALEPREAEGVRPWVAEPDWRVPGELIGAVGHREADAGQRASGLEPTDVELLGQRAGQLDSLARGTRLPHPVSHRAA